MVFWKKLFSNSDAVATSDTTGKDILSSDIKDDDQSQILFSTDRELDLYELEENFAIALVGRVVLFVRSRKRLPIVSGGYYVGGQK